MSRTLALAVLATSALACSGREARFPLRDAMWRDTDLDAVRARCHPDPTPSDPHHVSCAPKDYDATLYWDGGDNLFFRPLSEALGLVTSGESVNVNALDEVPDSAWFTNRIGARPMTVEEVARGACKQGQFLDPEHAAEGSWVIDKGKIGGYSPGFRVVIPGKGKFLLKAEDKNVEPERQAASSVIGASILWAAGYYSACEQVIYVRPSVFTLAPGLRMQKNFQPEEAFDQHALDAMLAQSTKRGGLVRLSASAWIEGHPIGNYSFDGTRGDDPNDVIPHEDRRDLRGLRLLAAWIDRFDAREANTFDTWIASDPRVPDSSPGIVLHYQLDTSETLGSTWAWEEISRRLGKSYVIDWGDLARDFVTLGIPIRAWDLATRTPGHEIFGFFNVRDFRPDHWRSEYPNKAFSRMTERDGAWMARILSHFTPEMIRALARSGNFSEESQATYLADVLEGRLELILERYLTRLSPISDLRVAGDELCGVDLAEMRRVREPFYFSYTAHLESGATLAVTKREGARVCVTVPHASEGAYLRVVIQDGVAKGPLVAHLYDLGARGFRLSGLERPNAP
jgi:hypothetical protein